MCAFAFISIVQEENFIYLIVGKKFSEVLFLGMQFVFGDEKLSNDRNLA